MWNAGVYRMEIRVWIVVYYHDGFFSLEYKLSVVVQETWRELNSSRMNKWDINWKTEECEKQVDNW